MSWSINFLRKLCVLSTIATSAYGGSSAHIVQLRADMADGSASYAAGSTSTPWLDQSAGSHDAVLVDFAGAANSSWQGDGTPTNPYRLEFNGADTVCTISDAIPELAMGVTTYSAAMWFRTGPDVSTSRYLVEWLETFGAPYAGMTIAYFNGQLRVYRGSGGWGDVTAITPNTWYHVVVSKQPGALDVYVNGALAANYATNENIGWQMSDVVLGASTFMGDGVYADHHVGAIAQFDIYDGPLTAGESLTLFEQDEGLYLTNKIVQLRADAADGIAAYAADSTTSPWDDLSDGSHDAALTGFSGAADSSWQGAGLGVSDPYRLEFDGSDDACVISDAVTELQMGVTEYSAAMWFRTGSDINANRYLVEWVETFGSPYAGMTFGYNAGQLRVYRGPAGWTDVAPLETTTWYHVLVSNQPGALDVYLNGDLVATYAADENIGWQMSDIVIGASTFAGDGVLGNFHIGAIAQFCVFDGALTTAQAESLYEADKALYTPSKIVELRADAADGAGPYATDSTSSPWGDLTTGGHDAGLTGFGGAPDSSWQGDGTAATNPYRLEFDGSGDLCAITDVIPELQTGVTQYSAALWFRTGSDITANRYVVEWIETFGSPYAGMTIGYEGGDLRVFRGAAGWTDIVPIATDSWYHVLVSKQPGALDVYVNGVLEATFAANENIGFQMSEVVLGAATFMGDQMYSNYHRGAIAQFCIFNAALSADEALAEFAADASLYFESGACCDDAFNCDDGVIESLCDGEFTADTLCDDLDPACEAVVSGACCRDVSGTCDEDVFEANCSGPSDTWTEGMACGAITCEAEDPTKVVQLRADMADGSGAHLAGSTSTPWVDLSGENNDAALVNFDGLTNSSWQGDGTPITNPYRLEFDGTDDRCSIPGGSVNGLQDNDYYSTAIWFKTGSDISSHRYLIEWNETFSSPWAGMTIGYQNSMLQVWLGTGWGDVGTLDTNTWYHVLVSKADTVMDVYVNGTLADSFSPSNTGSQVGEIALGTGTFAGAGVYNRFHQGAIAQLCIWVGALDADEALAEFNSDAPIYLGGLPGACCLPGVDDPVCLPDTTPEDCAMIANSVFAGPGTLCPTACPSCSTVSDCADLDDNGIRDDGCLFWDCLGGLCLQTEVVFADMGGQFLACPPDGTADNNDRNHALNCFADNDPKVPPPNFYPCEDSPPMAMNVDAGGPFGSCAPDGVCDGNDAFLALNAFEALTTCTCPLNPAPEVGGGGQPKGILGRSAIELVASAGVVRAGEVIEIEAYLQHPLKDLRGYQLHLGVSGGLRGTLHLVDVSIDVRPDSALPGPGFFEAFNVNTEQVLAGLNGPGVATLPNAYLATFIYEASPDAAGEFVIDVLHDPRTDTHRTFLFPTPAQGGIIVDHTTPAVVRVSTLRERRQRSR